MPSIPFDQLLQAILKAASFAARALAVTTDPDVAIVWHWRRKDWAFHSASAWTRPSQTSFLPWSSPPYPAVAFVKPDGTWTPGPAFKTVIESDRPPT